MSQNSNPQEHNPGLDGLRNVLADRFDAPLFPGSKMSATDFNNVTGQVSQFHGNPFRDPTITGATQPNPDFDSIVNDVLNTPSPIAGADTPQAGTGTGTAPKTPKASPLFGGDLHFHISPGGGTAQPEPAAQQGPDQNESIF